MSLHLCFASSERFFINSATESALLLRKSSSFLMLTGFLFCDLTFFS